MFIATLLDIAKNAKMSKYKLIIEWKSVRWSYNGMPYSDEVIATCTNVRKS